MPRRLFFWVLIIFFFISAPIILFYSHGVRINKESQHLFSTGTIVTSTEPTDARILLNGKKTKHNTPTTIQALLPGRYLIRIEKDGYLPWQKRLRVVADNAVFISELLLFRNDLPELVQSGKYIHLWADDNHTNAILISTRNESSTAYLIGQSFLTNKTTIQNLGTTERPEKITRVTWSPLSQFALVQSGDTHHLYNKNNGQVTKLPSILTHITWGETSDHLYASLQNGDIVTIDNEGNQLVTILSRNDDFNVTDMLFLDNQLITLELNNAEAARLVYYDQNGKKNSEILLATPNTHKFVSHSQKLLAINNEQGKLTVVEDRRNETRVMHTASHGRKASFSKDGKKLLYWNDFELWFFDTTIGEEQLILRSEERIRKATWHPETEHILFRTDNSIFLTELDNRDQRNQWPLVEATALVDYFVPQDGGRLYFIGSIGSQQGLFEKIL